MEFPFDKLREGIIAIGVNAASYDKEQAICLKENGESLQTRKDFIWKCYQDLLLDIAEKITPLHDMFQLQRKVYCEMFYFLCKEEKPRTVAQKVINHCDIQIAMLSGLKLNAKVLGIRDCVQSKEIDGRIMPIEEAAVSDLLPYKACTRLGGCTCCYVFETMRDENGRLIQSKIG